MDSLLVEQEFMNGIDTDKVHPYIEDQIAQKVDLVKVSSLFYYTRNARNNGCLLGASIDVHSKHHKQWPETKGN